MDNCGQLCKFTTVNEFTKKNGINGHVYHFEEGGGKGVAEILVNPYGSVDIVERFHGSSEKLQGNNSQAEIELGLHKGSTLSLPLQKASVCSLTLDTRAKSAGNDLDSGNRHIRSIKDAKRRDLGDPNSDVTLNSLGETENASSETSSNQGHDSINSSRSSERSRKLEGGGTTSGLSEATISSYIRIGSNNGVDERGDMLGTECECCCHGDAGQNVATGNSGYVTTSVMVNHEEKNCPCQQSEQMKYMSFENDINLEEEIKMRLLTEALKNSMRPVSQVCNIPPHFFESMSSLPVDPTRTTEL